MEWGIDRRWTALAATVLTVPLIQIFVFSVIPDPFVGSFDKMGLFYKSGGGGPSVTSWSSPSSP
ncbi:hypothetical protein [Methanomethylophilus alvi]|uniref:hypothetical protein n=1 Tax=Methanomethylophilus alvi TaxID=1291540 RepID=UPI0037DD05FD